MSWLSARPPLRPLQRGCHTSRQPWLIRLPEPPPALMGGRAQGGEGGERPVRAGRGRPKRKFQVVRGLNNLGYSERFACKVVGLDRSTYYDIKFRKPNDREIRSEA